MTDQPLKIIPADKAPKPLPDGRGRPPKWHLEGLKVGEAMEIPPEKLQSVRQKCSALNRQYADKHLKDGLGLRRWSAGEAEDGKFYVWRHQ